MRRYLKQKLKNNKLKKENKSVPTVSVEDVEAIISEKSGIPLGKIQNDEQNQLKNNSKKNYLNLK